MSGFETPEISVEAGRPVFLYQFTLGSTVYRRASGEDTVTADSADWEGSQISHSAIEVSPEARTQTITVTMPSTDSFPQRYVNSVPSTRASLKIYKLHRGDTSAETYLLFSGIVRTVQWGDNGRVAKILVKPIEGAMDKSVPRLGFSSQCPLMLFDANCKAVRASFLFNGTAASVSGNEVTVTGLDASKTVGWATGGELVVTTTGERRLIKEHKATDIVVLNFPFDASPLNQSVEVAAGCDRTLGTCQTKFSNEINFGGSAFVPGRNIFATGLK